ncbi:hypothetical protein C2E23DRAFT_524317 [Lenzites betulinus]|nr:hypothetical protein C2E23DRAFT_524317 [Lenzites betulinus]
MAAGGAITDWSVLLPANSTITEGNYTLLSSICLFYYDYIITIPSEVRVIWKPRLSLASSFYLLTRYGFLVNITLIALFSVRSAQDAGFTNTLHSCRLFYSVDAFINFFNFVVISAFVAARIYAIWDRNWVLAITTFLLGLVNPNSVTVLFALRLKAVLAPWPVWGCEAYIPDDEIQITVWATQRLPIIASAISILYEVLCLLLTIWKTHAIHRLQRESGKSVSLTSLLLRDGSQYFLVMTALSTANIIAAVVPGIPSNVAVNTVFGRALTPILTTRFIAHLRQVDLGDSTDSPSSAVWRREPSRLFTSVGGPTEDLCRDEELFARTLSSTVSEAEALPQEQYRIQP